MSSLLKDRLDSRNEASANGPENEKDIPLTTYFPDEEEVPAPETKKSAGKNSRLKKLKEKNNPEPEITPEEYEEILYQEELTKQRTKARREKRAVRVSRTSTIILTVLCVYLVFLIYGAINTDYVYDNTGKVVPLSMSVDALKSKRDYENVSGMYLQARTLYEKILVLDYRIAAGQEDQVLVATEYEKLLTDVEKLTIQLKELVQLCPAEYTQVVNMLTLWVGTHAAAYCQNISAAITQNNAYYGDEAIQGRSVMYDDFSLITKNIATLGSQADGCEAIVLDIISWSPEGYIQDAVGYVP